ncbi:MAG TPA: EAL domain-containing protein [Candidatus Limnocylindrales bacterium]|nr:EAL domain-containing protein [Candidatus Limnocylindrales bacterium]
MVASARRTTAARGVAASSPDSGRLLDDLATLAGAVASAPDLRAIYRALFTFTQAISPTHGIFVSLYDPARRLRTCVFSGRADGEDDVSDLPPMPMSGSPQSVAIETGRPVVIDDLDAAIAGLPVVNVGIDVDPRLPKSAIAVPMAVLGRMIGAFEAQSLEPAAYTEEHVVAMRMAANLAALATERVLMTDPAGRDPKAGEDIRAIIADRAFCTVFQPIVELESGAIIGYEALTRFADGSSPGDRFPQATAVGLGLELEAVTLEAAFRAAESLPANALLNLNVSPELVLAREPLGSLMRHWGWQTILELTEHTAVHDYEALRAAIRELGPNVRLAVDDAGAGFASFRHILELRPDFVKLDRAIVAGLDADLARQALVAGMRHFAVTTGCSIIAEGIETEAELAALRSLGVTLGQGFHLGPPAPPRPIAAAAVSLAQPF